MNYIPFISVLVLIFIGISNDSISQTLRGVSGMSLIDQETLESEFLYINDFKARPGEDTLKRFGILTTTSNLEYSGWKASPVDSEDWSRVNDTVGNDFEAICKIPETNQFLVVESSYYKGRYGRIIIVELLKTKNKTSIIANRAIKLPKDVQQIEGLVCVKLGQEDGNKILVIISERDGKTNNKTIRWEFVDLTDKGIKELKFSESLQFQTPEPDEMTRDVTDLYLDPSGRLWCSASRDMGDYGPFKSAIYLIGRVNTEKCCKVFMYSNPIKKLELEGFKIEALAAPVIPGSTFTIGTDDEKLGSVFRPIGF